MVPLVYNIYTIYCRIIIKYIIVNRSDIQLDSPEKKSGIKMYTKLYLPSIHQMAAHSIVSALNAQYIRCSQADSMMSSLSVSLACPSTIDDSNYFNYLFLHCCLAGFIDIYDVPCMCLFLPIDSALNWVGRTLLLGFPS